MSTIIAHYEGHERVTLAGRGPGEWSGPNAEGDLCRWLIAEGSDPAGPIEFHRAGRGAMLGTVAGFAARAYSGGEATASWWAPHPRAETPPLLSAWHAHTAAARRAGRVVA